MNGQIFLLGLLLSLFSFKAFADQLIVVQPIGTSPKKQYFAYEEYGYYEGTKVPYSVIKFINLGTQASLDSHEVKVSGDDLQGDRLEQIRKKAIEMAQANLAKFNIASPI